MTPDFLKDIEAKLKDRCSDYLLVCIHDEKTWDIYSSQTNAYGMAKMVEKDIENEWKFNREEAT